MGFTSKTSEFASLALLQSRAPMYNYNTSMDDNIISEFMEPSFPLNPKRQSEKLSHQFAPPLAPVLLGHPAIYNNPNDQSGMDLSLPSVMPVHRYPFPPMAGFTIPMNYREAPKRAKFIVIFDWDDTLFPTTAIQQSQGDVMNVEDLSKFGKSVYKLLEKYIHRFGTDNMRIVTNGTKSWVLESLKMMSDLYRGYFDGADDKKEQKERDQDYFAAIYNTLISDHPIPIVSAQDEYAERYPERSIAVIICPFHSIKSILYFQTT